LRHHGQKITENRRVFIDKTGIHGIAISYVEEAFSTPYNFPEALKPFATSITDNPAQNARNSLVYCCPYPNLVFFNPNKSLQFVNLGNFGNF